MVICLVSLRTFSAIKPYIKRNVDKFAEVAQWQVFFVMLGALMIKASADVCDANVDSCGEASKRTKVFDALLMVVQLASPVLMFMIWCAQGRARVRRWTATQEDGIDPKSEAGMEMSTMNAPAMALAVKKRGTALGGCEAGSPPVKSYLRVNSQGLLDVKSKGKTGDDSKSRAGAFASRNSILHSSFSSNEEVWFEHEIKDGPDKGKAYYNQPKTGEVVWTRPEEAEIKNAKGIRGEGKAMKKKAPIRPSMIPLPPGVKGAEDCRPLPAVTLDDDDDVLPPPPCPWTEHWSDEHQALYYIHEDGRSDWEVPESEFWKND